MIVGDQVHVRGFREGEMLALAIEAAPLANGVVYSRLSPMTTAGRKLKLQRLTTTKSLS